ncbi:hypothetical protein, partial [Acinetobacter baumannii]|uniref:hypothetical protein n=1 Tax=Acinetobacter baumannii TaxID=470 RepID=UPI002B22B923
QQLSCRQPLPDLLQQLSKIIGTIARARSAGPVSIEAVQQLSCRQPLPDLLQQLSKIIGTIARARSAGPVSIEA